MSKGWYPVIDYEKCVGCMACSNMCRHGVYKQDPETGRPKVVYGTGCVHGCHGCERNCPAGAIRYFGDDGILDIDYDYESYKPEIQCAGKPKVAFVCVHNSCRSQIAEALGSEVGFKGIAKKVLIFLLVGIANILDVQVIGTGSVLRTAIIFFYISNEGVSLLENAGHLGLPIPEKLKDILAQLHDRAENGKGDE